MYETDYYMARVKTGNAIKEFNKTEVLNDYRIACESRQASILGRREVLTGKAKFGIFGDGKEVPQLAMAKVFRDGDWRSGYYRDQTFMLAAGIFTLEEFFAQLYGDTDLLANPENGGVDTGVEALALPHPADVGETHGAPAFEGWLINAETQRTLSTDAESGE